jgi:alpha-ketoglutarate-dependent taurine dioxygenase
VRYDPGCMHPCDQRAHQIVEFFLRLEAEQIVSRHNWNEGDVLLIDNSRCLHGRSAILDGDEERALERMSFYIEQK